MVSPFYVKRFPEKEGQRRPAHSTPLQLPVLDSLHGIDLRCGFRLPSHQPLLNRYSKLLMNLNNAETFEDYPDETPQETVGINT